MRVLKTILVLLLGFILGIASTLAGIVGGGYYIIYNVTPEVAESTVQGFVPEFALPENLPTELMTMTIMEIVNEIIDIAGSMDTLTLNELQERLGYQLPLELSDGTDLTFLFAPIMDIPIKQIPDNMNLVIDNITINSLVTLGIMSEDDLPNLPMFSSADSKDTPIMSLFSDLGNFKIADMITLYTGDYYPLEVGDFVLLTVPVYIDYDENNVLHEDLTRYKLGYVVDEEGDFVRVEGEFIAYDSATHENLQRYSSAMLPSFNGDKVLSNPETDFIGYDPMNPNHQGKPRFMKPTRSADVLLAIGDAYINTVPDTDPDGLNISDTIKNLQVKDIMKIDENSANIILAIQDAYLGDTAPVGGLTLNETIETIQVKEIIDIYEADVFEEGILIHAKSNQVLIAIKDAYVGNNPTPPGLTINDTIDTLTLGQIIEITDDSSTILKELKDTTINELDESLNSLKLKQTLTIYTEDIFDNEGQLVEARSNQILIALQEAYIGQVPLSDPAGKTISEAMDTLYLEDLVIIYDGTEMIPDAIGNFYRVPATYEAYDELNPLHSGLTRYRLSVIDNGYYPDIEGGYVVEADAEYVLNGDPLYINYFLNNPGNPELPTYSLAAPSSTLMTSLRTSQLETIDNDINELALGEIMTIDENSSMILISLQNTSLNDLDAKVNTLKLGEVLEVYEEDVYEEGVLVHPKSSVGLITLKDTTVNDLDSRISTLTLRDVQDIYENYEYSRDDVLGTYIIDGYEDYDGGNQYHLGLQRYSDTACTIEDDLGDYVKHYRLAVAGVDDLITERYVRINPSSKFILSLADTTLVDMGTAMDDLKLSDMMDIDSSSPKILQTLSDSTINNLEDSFNDLTLDDVIDIYSEDEYTINDVSGYFVFFGGAYVVYDPIAHSGLTRYDRTIGVSSVDDKVYELAVDGAFALVVGAPDTYEPYDALLHSVLPRYNYLCIKSSNVVVSLRDANIYGDANTLQESLDNLTLIDVLGDPTPGTLFYEISYTDGSYTTPTKITDIEPRITEVMENAEMEDLSNWGIIDITGIDPVKWNNIKDLTIQEFLDTAINFMP